MRNEQENFDQQLQQLKQSILDVSQQKINTKKQPYSFHKRLEEQRQSSSTQSYDSNRQIDVLQASEYLKLLCHQKKYLSKKRADKISELNESLKIQQDDFKYLFMVATQANYYKLEHPGYYDRLVQSVPTYPKSMFSAIQKDIPRTLLNEHPFQVGLRNILIAYAIRNPNLLYCQGMNYLVAYFLINNICQEETFWILVCLAENILPDDYFKDLSTISITTQIFSDVLPYLFPQMAKQMKQIGMDCSLFIVSWYVCLFTKGFINSVSEYLLVKLVLQRRSHSVGFILLRLSLGIIATILGRDEPFTFRRQFTALRDKLQMSVFQISLLEIKLGIEYVELNQQNYLKLQKYYRAKRQQRHINAVEKDMKNKKFTLPKCEIEYPICLHRIEIERKVGNVEEVLITKNGYNIMSQYIEDYFDSEPRKQSTCSVYDSIDACLIYRQKHICEENILDCQQLTLQQKMTNRVILRHDESFQFNLKRQRELMLQDGSSSMEVHRRFSKMDSKFIELSGFFIVDQKFKFGDEQVIEDDQDSQDLQDNRIISKNSLEQPFDLEKQLQKNNISRDWINNQDQYTSIEEKKWQNGQAQLVQQQQSKNIKQIDYLGGKQTSKEEKQSFQFKNGNQSNDISNKHLESNQKTDKSSSFMNKRKILNYFYNVWKKVRKIKEQELKN